MATNFLSTRTGQFSYFDQILGQPNWRHRQVLDFGGNLGNLLLDSQCAIWPQNYTCIDIIKNAVDMGRSHFPSARWIHYDRYHSAYNAQGVVDLPIPDDGTRYHYILAYSVFTHLPPKEMHRLIAQLTRLLHQDGLLAFTFIDPHHQSWPRTERGNNLDWRLRKNLLEQPDINRAELLDQARNASWCTLINERLLFVDQEVPPAYSRSTYSSYHVYHTCAWIQQNFPQAMIYPPVNGEMQHCCVVRPMAAVATP